MSALRGAPTEVFELQRSSSLRASRPDKYGDMSQAVGRDLEYEEEEVEESVREDMDKLEDTFPGISDRFRLVNRIGEGIIAQSASIGDLDHVE